MVIERIPVPTEETPWESIIEFRNDQESKGSLAALRLWISEVAKGEMELNEIGAKLDHLLYQYRKAMSLHRMKFRQAALEALSMTSDEILEKLVNFRWVKSGKQMFDMRRKEIELLEAEMNAPGHELSYIMRAREKFAQSQ